MTPMPSTGPPPRYVSWLSVVQLAQLPAARTGCFVPRGHAIPNGPWSPGHELSPAPTAAGEPADALAGMVTATRPVMTAARAAQIARKRTLTPAMRTAP